MKRKLAQILRGNRGGALIIVLGVLMMLIIAALSAVDTAQQDIELTFNQLHADQAFYVAEAGLQQAICKLGQHNLWDTGYVNVPFEQGVYSVAVIHSDIDSALIDSVKIRSAGTVQQAHANLEALVVPRLSFPFGFAMFGDDSLMMTNSTCTDSYNSDSGTYLGTVLNEEGDIASNGIIELTNAATVGGDVSSADTGGVSVCATCTAADTASGVEPFYLEPIPDSEFVYAHDYNSAPGGISGGFTYDGITHDLTLATNQIIQLSGGTYYFNDMNLASNSIISIVPGDKVKIYMTGDLILQNNTSVNSTGVASDLLIFSSGSIHTVGMSIDIQAAFYGPDADVVINNGCEYYGSIIAGSVSIDNAACVHYDRALGTYPVSTTGEMIMIAWKEL
ncbi:MAG: hypothetical protein JSU74_09695 [Candidatus Zixiibacteriota bacterium]|nr:MAG: hypothetical protein JSU74_09695 [candidate division Zixibacteria bacterium]